MDNITLEKINSERDFLTMYEGVNFLWVVEKYRNQVFWTSTYRYGAVVILMTILPYLLPDIIGKLGYAVMIFPIMAFLISAFGAYLMAVEYKLYKQAVRKFRSFLGKYCPEDIPNDKPINRIFRISLGAIMSGTFLCFAFIGQFCNGLVLYYLINNIAQ